MSNLTNIAFVFPGQGSQKVGMLADYADNSIFKGTFEEASQVLGYDLWAATCEGPQEKINQTEVTQPLLLTCSVALWRIWQDKGGARPAYMAGHSLGEWSALVCAGVLAFKDAVNLVRLRGKYMQEAVPPGEGAMAAIIGMSDEAVEKACASVVSRHVVAPVNYNSPGQLVIAGGVAAVELAIAACKEAGAKKAMSLPVSAPFHTSLMKPAADRLAAEIEATSFVTPEIPVIHNVTAKPEVDPVVIKRLMIAQIYTAVRWVSCVQYIVDEGVVSAVECGPGKVLSGLNRRIDSSLRSFDVNSLSALESALQDL
ncbi:MAG: [acyl-carrier-protein] S-malonyltransferase [Lentisphaeria bacterium]|jgi:[acyl-carrier-protein] S-malonyltransferase